MRCIILFFIIFLLTLPLLFAISPTSYDNTTLIMNPDNAYDADSFSYANITGVGNVTYFDFNTLENNSEIMNINLTLLYKANLSGSYSFFWSLNNTWSLINSSSNNITKSSNTFYVPIISWDEIRNNLSILFTLTNVDDTFLIYELSLDVIFDNLGPHIDLLWPYDDYIQNSSEINFSFITSDSLSGIENCSIYINGILNDTKFVVIENQEINFSLNLTNGFYNWSIGCYDNSTGYYFNNSEIRRLNIDLLAPNITLSSPDNDSVYSSGEPIELRFNFSDVSDNASCSLLINDTVFDTGVHWPFIDQYFLVYLSNGDYFWQINCTDYFGNYALSEKRFFTLENNEPPYFTDSKLTQNISLILGSKTLVWCNTTINDGSSSEIINAKAKFVYGTYDDIIDDAFIYVNNSCTLLPNNATSRLAVCAFNVTSHARAGDWFCYLNSTDSGGLTTYFSNITRIEPFYAINISPAYISYGLWKSGDITDDVSLKVSNLGNSPMDISLEGFGLVPYDGLAMVCDIGNISISDHRYSLISGTVFNSMTSLTNNPVLVDINLDSPTEFSLSEDDIYWKMKLPSPLNGSCDGNVVITAVPN